MLNHSQQSYRQFIQLSYQTTQPGEQAIHTMDVTKKYPQKFSDILYMEPECSIVLSKLNQLMNQYVKLSNDESNSISVKQQKQILLNIIQSQASTNLKECNKFYSTCFVLAHRQFQETHNKLKTQNSYIKELKNIKKQQGYSFQQGYKIISAQCQTKANYKKLEKIKQIFITLYCFNCKSNRILSKILTCAFSCHTLNIIDALDQQKIFTLAQLQKKQINHDLYTSQAKITKQKYIFTNLLQFQSTKQDLENNINNMNKIQINHEDFINQIKQIFQVSYQIVLNFTSQVIHNYIVKRQYLLSILMEVKQKIKNEIKQYIRKYEGQKYSQQAKQYVKKYIFYSLIQTMKIIQNIFKQTAKQFESYLKQIQECLNSIKSIYINPKFNFYFSKQHQNIINDNKIFEISEIFPKYFFNDQLKIFSMQQNNDNHESSSSSIEQSLINMSNSMEISQKE